MIEKRKLMIIVGLFTLFLLSWTVVAQDGDGVDGECPELVERALFEMGENCSTVDRNSACYGFNQVDATFTEAVDEEFFNTPSDITELVTVQSLQTLPYDLEEERWGVALMNVQANVPNILPGQAVTFMLVGDVEVDNDVDSADVTEPLEPFGVLATVRANVRSGDSVNSNVLGVVEVGTDLTADAVNEARTWVRVVYGGRLAWVSTDVLEPIADIETLPTVDGQLISPMQAFYFSTGVGQPTCNDAPDVLAIRSPENIVVDLSVNGANISVGSLIILKQIDANLFLIYVEEGRVETEDGQIVFEGRTIIGEMDEDGNWVQWLEVREATEEEQGWGDLFVDGYTAAGLIEDIPVFVGGSCGSFVPTSPLLGLGYGQNAFYWDAYNSATSYRVWVINQGGGSISFETNGAETSLVGNLTNETIGGGFDFAWYVEALVNGRVVCTSQTIVLQRSSEAVVTGPAFWASWTCGPSGSYSTNFSWGNLPAGETVTFNFTENGGPLGLGPFSAASGTQNYNSSALPISAASATTSGGVVYPLAGVLTCF